MEETILIVSDLHLGAGEKVGGKKNVLEDFHYDEKFKDFLQWKCSLYPYPLELVILGDAFDFPQVLPEIGKRCADHRCGTTQKESLTRMKCIIEGHGTFFDALKDFLSKGNTVRFLRGNHDIDLIWPDVLALLKSRIGGGSNLIFETNYAYHRMGLYCEHGNQYSTENAFDNPRRPVVKDQQGAERLSRCWGTYFMDEVYNDIEAQFPIIDNVKDGQVIRGALMAIKSTKVRFSGKVIARMLKIAYRAGLPVTGWVGSFVLGEETGELPPKDQLTSGQIAVPKDFIKYLRDPEISAILLRQYEGDPDFRKEFDAEIADLVHEQAGKELQILPTEDVNRTMGLITGKSSYQRAAEKILQKDLGVEIVVFGHTHQPIDGNYPPKPMTRGVQGKYFNSGSWTFSVDLDDPHNQGLSFDKLCESGVRKDTLDFVEVTITPDGAVQAVLGHV